MKRFVLILCVLAVALFAASPAHAAHGHFRGGRGFGFGAGLLGNLFGLNQQPIFIQQSPVLTGGSFGGQFGVQQSPVFIEEPVGGFGLLGSPFGGFGRFGGGFRHHR